MARFWIRDTVSIIAIAGGALFLVLPVGFLAGTVSITSPLVTFCHVPPQEVHSCPLYPLNPSPNAAMASFWASLGVVCVFLGLVALKLNARTGVIKVLGLAFPLGIISLLAWTLGSQILRIFIITPSVYRLFPQLSIAAIVGATVLLTLELFRRWLRSLAHLARNKAGYNSGPNIIVDLLRRRL